MRVAELTRAKKRIRELELEVEILRRASKFLEVRTGEIVVYQREDGAPAIDVRLDGETVWVAQAQLVDLFQSSKANINERIKNIFDEGELEVGATVRDFRTVRQEGARKVDRVLTYCNLNVILSVGLVTRWVCICIYA
jgi:hypothetical protein